MILCVGNLGISLPRGLWTGLPHALCRPLATGVWLPRGLHWPHMHVSGWLKSWDTWAPHSRQSQGSSVPRRLEQKLQDLLRSKLENHLCYILSVRVHHKASLVGWASTNIWPATTWPCTSSLTYFEPFWASVSFFFTMWIMMPLS